MATLASGESSHRAALQASLVEFLGEDMNDAEEGELTYSSRPLPSSIKAEMFNVFSQSMSSQDLGMVDPKVQSLDVSIGSRDFSIAQSPGLLRSEIKAGTTGAVLWRISPLLAAWLIDEENLLCSIGLLRPESCVVELGSGTGMLGIALAPLVSQVVLTDQAHMIRLLQRNVKSNPQLQGPKKQHPRAKASSASQTCPPIVMRLDWENDSATNLLDVIGPNDTVDLLIASDCIYNDFLIGPFVQTCSDICALRNAERPTVVLIAQQLRSEHVFGKWLQEMLTNFLVWRVPNHTLPKSLKEGSGYVLHVAITRR